MDQIVSLLLLIKTQTSWYQNVPFTKRSQKKCCMDNKMGLTSEVFARSMDRTQRFGLNTSTGFLK